MSRAMRVLPEEVKLPERPITYTISCKIKSATHSAAFDITICVPALCNDLSAGLQEGIRDLEAHLQKPFGSECSTPPYTDLSKDDFAEEETDCIQSR